VVTWVQSFFHKNGLKFSEKVDIFPKIYVFSKKGFYVGLLMQRSLEGALGVCAVRPLARHW